MSKHSPEDGTARTERLLASLYDEIVRLKSIIKSRRKTLETGGEEATTGADIKPEVARLTGILDACHKAESKLEDFRDKHSPRADGLDFEAARVAIRCQLDRLARCHRP